jgi:tetratricopeptide (TPR) repeat protein
MLRFLISISIALLFVNNAYACATFAEEQRLRPFFDRPSYIDDQHEFSYIDDRFGLVLKQYGFYPKTKESSDGSESRDAAARSESKKQEPKKFSRYTEAAEKFNRGDYKQALDGFADIRDSFSIGDKLHSIMNGKNIMNDIMDEVSYSWAKEAATYMVARCQLNMAVKNWDGYSDPLKSVDQAMLHSAATSYQQYVTNYPKGMYVNSAKNIRRRIAYLSGQQEALDQALKQAMLETFPIAPQTSGVSNYAIINEFENHFRGEIDISSDSPMLVAYKLLEEENPNAKTVTTLEAREKDFSTYPGLFRYLHALALYKSAQYQQLIDKIPEKPISKDALSLSTQILRARALQRIGKFDEAIDALRKMHAVSPEDAVELEIAYLKLDSGDALWLYKKESPLKSEKVLRSIAQFALTDSELEGAVSDEQIADEKRKFLMDELAKRYILTERFRSASDLFNKDYSGSFLPLKSSVDVLVLSPNDPKALADIGEFLYQNYTESELYGLGLPDLSPPPRCKPCSNFDERTANYKPPMAFFQSAVKNSIKSGKKSEGEAKALSYIARYGRGNSSKTAFVRLHKLYKNSYWAKKTPYHY